MYTAHKVQVWTFLINVPLECQENGEERSFIEVVAQHQILMDLYALKFNMGIYPMEANLLLYLVDDGNQRK